MLLITGLRQAEEPSDSEEEDEFVYNPLKLPLGYDGKPIPYWLYKLHGLNQVQLNRCMPSRGLHTHVLQPAHS